jgi:hypothetical protein
MPVGRGPGRPAERNDSPALGDFLPPDLLLRVARAYRLGPSIHSGARRASTLPSPSYAALEAQLRHVHTLGSLGSFETLGLRQGQIDPLEKAVEECSPSSPQVGIVGAVGDDQGKTADPAAELPLGLTHVVPRFPTPVPHPSALSRPKSQTP